MKKEHRKVLRKENTVLDSVLSKIEKEEIKPIPKWRYILKDIVTGVFICSGIISGIIGLTMSFIYWSKLDMDIIHINTNYIDILNYILPIFWIGIIVVSILVTYFTFIKSEKGYRYNIGLILILFGLLVISTSIFSYYADLRLEYSRGIEHIIGRDVIDPRYRMWNRPDQGFFAGEIVKKLDEDIYIIDFNGKEWVVDTSDTMYSMRFDIKEGVKIKIKGEIVEGNLVKAKEIRPWDGPRYGCMQERGCRMRSIR